MKIDWTKLSENMDVFFIPYTNMKYAGMYDIPKLKEKLVETGFMTQEQFQDLLDADPTYGGGDKVGSYIPWLINMYKKDPGNFSFKDAAPYVHTYHKAKWNDQYIPKELQQISNIKSYDVFVEAVKPLLNKDVRSFNQFKNDIASTPKHYGDWFDVMYTSPNYQLIAAKNKEAACYFGKGSTWCTAALDQTSPHYNYYSSDGTKPLYIIIDKKNGEKFQIAKLERSYDFNDINNNQLVGTELVEVMNEFDSELKELLKGLLYSDKLWDEYKAPFDEEAYERYLKNKAISEEFGGRGGRDDQRELEMFEERNRELEEYRQTELNYLIDINNFNAYMEELEQLVQRNPYDTHGPVTQLLSRISYNLPQSYKLRILDALFVNESCPRFILFCYLELGRILFNDVNVSILNAPEYVVRFTQHLLYNDVIEGDAFELIFDEPNNYIPLLRELCNETGRLIISNSISNSNQEIVRDCIMNPEWTDHVFNIHNPNCILDADIVGSLLNIEQDTQQ